MTDWRRSIFFTDEERVALDYAEAVTVRSDAIDRLARVLAKVLAMSAIGGRADNICSI
jgi:alkylhydroperoxidase family enzyme